MIQNLREVYQLHITLLDIRPPIWRRFLVLKITPLDELHQILQTVMGWEDCHLYEFTVGNERNTKSHSVPDDEFEELDTLDESKFRISDLLKKEGDKIRYVYDFGDNWRHTLKLEKILPFEIGKSMPVCVKGSRASPIEEIGGTFGYANFLEAYMDREHPEHQEMQEWADEHFHPDYFDLDEVNKNLRQIFKL